MKIYVTVVLILLAALSLSSASEVLEPAVENEHELSPEAGIEAADKSPSASTVTPIQTSTTKSTGRTAYIDPNTGRLTSTPPVGSEPSNRDAKTVEPEPEVIEHPDGMLEIVLNGQLHSNVNAHIDCDGDIEQQHSDHEPTESAKVDCESE